VADLVGVTVARKKTMLLDTSINYSERGHK